MLTIFQGIIGRGFQFASGQASRRADYHFRPEGTLKSQRALFKKQKIDLKALIPGLFWGTINLEISRKLLLKKADYVARNVDWTRDLPPEHRIGAETFSFVHCCFVYPAPEGQRGMLYYPGLIYYPHPETKPTTNRHHFDALEVLTVPVTNLVYGTPASVVCRADAFEAF